MRQAGNSARVRQDQPQGDWVQFGHLEQGGNDDYYDVHGGPHSGPRGRGKGRGGVGYHGHGGGVDYYDSGVADDYVAPTGPSVHGKGGRSVGYHEDYYDESGVVVNYGAPTGSRGRGKGRGGGSYRGGHHNRGSGSFKSASVGTGLQRKLNELELELAAEKEKSELKRLTIKQMNDLVAKNKVVSAELESTRAFIKELEENVADLKFELESEKENKLLDDEVHEEKENLQENLDDLNKRYSDLQRKLGSTDYRKLVASNINQALESMENPTRELFEDFTNEQMTDRETIKFCLGAVNRIAPTGKLAFIKSFLALESPVMRENIFIATSNLVEADRVKDKFVKEVLDDKEGPENTDKILE